MLIYGNFLTGIPKNVDYAVVKKSLLSVEGIVAVHNLRIWGLTTDKNAIIAHCAIRKFANVEQFYHDFTLNLF